MLNKIDKDHNEVEKEQQSKNKLVNSLIKLSLIWALTLSSCGSPKNSFNNQQNDITSKLLSKANKVEYIKDNNVIYFKDNNWEIYFIKDSSIRVSSQKKPWWIMDENWKYVNWNELISVQQFKENLKWKIVIDTVFKQTCFWDLANIILTIDWKEVFASDLSMRFYRTSKNELETYKTALQVQNDKILILRWQTYNMIVPVDKNYKEMINDLNFKLDSIKKEIEKIDISKYCYNWFTFKDKEEENLAKVYAWIVDNISYDHEWKWQSCYEWLLTWKTKCNGYAKIFVQLARKFWIKDIEKKVGYNINLFSWKPFMHAWVWKWNYIYDPTNEKYLWNKTVEYWKSNFFKVPKYIADLTYIEKKLTQEEYDNFVNERDNKFSQLKEQIKKDKENWIHYYLHNINWEIVTVNEEDEKTK